MITVTPQMRIMMAVEAIDFRNGIDGLAGLCRNHFREDPFSGCAYVFRNRRGTALKVLVYDGQGYWLCQKRLSSGRFRWRPDAGSDRGLTSMEARDLQLLLWNGDPGRAAMSPLWRKVG